MGTKVLGPNDYNFSASKEWDYFPYPSKVWKPWTITGNARNNTLTGGEKNDTIFGGLGDDTIFGLAGNDLLFGQAGDDRLYGGSGDDSLSGSDGNDVLEGGAGNDYMDGGSGNDYYYVDSFNDKIIELSGFGLDTVETSLSGYNLAANVENLVVSPFSNGGSFFGNYLANTMYGNATGNELYGMDGNDTIFGRGGNDILIGGAGSDVLYGDDGNDLLYGSYDADQLYGGAGHDVLYGGGGNDYLVAGTGTDVLLGESGNDTLVGSEGSGSAMLNGSATVASNYFDPGEFDTLIGGIGYDTFVLGGTWGVSYFESGDGYATIQNFDYSRDKIQVKGGLGTYSLEFKELGGVGSSAKDTEIYFTSSNGVKDRIGIVQDTTNISINRDFLFV